MGRKVLAAGEGAGWVCVSRVGVERIYFRVARTSFTLQMAAPDLLGPGRLAGGFECWSDSDHQCHLAAHRAFQTTGLDAAAQHGRVRGHGFGGLRRRLRDDREGGPCITVTTK